MGSAKLIGFSSSSLGSQAVRINIGNAYVYTLRGHQLFNLYQVLQPALEQGVLQEGVGLVLHAHAALLSCLSSAPLSVVSLFPRVVKTHTLNFFVTII